MASSRARLMYFADLLLYSIVGGRAVDPHSLYTDPDPAVFLNADPGPGLA